MLGSDIACVTPWPAGAAQAVRAPERVVGRVPTLKRPWLLILSTAFPLWIGVGVTRLATFMLTEDRDPGVFYIAMAARLAHLSAVLLVALLCYRAALEIRWDAERRWRALLPHAALALIVGFMSRPLLIAAATAFDPAFVLADDWLSHFRGQGVRYWLISGFGFVSSYVFGLVLMLGTRAALELRDVELEKVRLYNDWMRSRLQVLRMQMNPHFVCNALNTISSAISADPQRARALVVRFSDLFRRALTLSDADWVELREELAFVEDYLQLESARFGARLSFAIEVESAAARVRVPTLLLQPLIENAVRHGVADDRDTLQIAVRITTVADAGVQSGLCVEITNRSTGPLPANGPARFGLGNTRARLQAIYGDEGRLQLERPDACSFRATLWLPLAQTHGGMRP